MTNAVNSWVTNTLDGALRDTYVVVEGLCHIEEVVRSELQERGELNLGNLLYDESVI